MNAEHVINGWIAQLRLDARDHNQSNGQVRAVRPAAAPTTVSVPEPLAALSTSAAAEPALAAAEPVLSVPEPRLSTLEPRRRLRRVHVRTHGEAGRRPVSGPCLGLA